MICVIYFLMDMPISLVTDNKKFLKRKLKELLAEISAEPVSKQKEMLDHAFELWRGDNGQLDDILIIGIRCH